MLKIRDPVKIMDIELMPENIRELLKYRKLFEVVKLSVETGLYSHMDTPKTVSDLSEATGIEPGFLERLLKALGKFGYVQILKDGDKIAYVNTPVSDQYLNSDSLTYIGTKVFEDIETGTLLQNYIREGPATVTITNDFWSPELLEWIASMSLTGGVQSTVSVVDLSGRKKMLDIGGGHGLYSIFFTKKYPGLRSYVLDLPQVAELTKNYIAKFNAEGQVEAIPGDYHDLKTAEKYDVVLVSNVTSSLEDFKYLMSLSYELLEKGGLIVLRNYVSDLADDWSSLVALERFSRRGKDSFSSVQIMDALKGAGFATIKKLYSAEGILILQAEKP
ncbi:hypothetical protein CUJ83_10310 [Methanocella sp. CWC-04]|uniref:Dimerisation domain-containing protein n=1 Tax=Methanooceanicella nereidis TaxID=2052831 RepID=A0AAP2W7T7_9EURY|nr:acetylserotonin O-methyltransferase [Methanocella sp. CWC-04]MCD1295391.1 hypothetical protein [Methanocella sp. CWC-04]